MAEIDDEQLQAWAEVLSDAADTIKPPSVTADHDQKLAKARERLGGREPDVEKALGRPGTGVEIVAAVLRHTAGEIWEAERGAQP